MVEVVVAVVVEELARFGAEPERAGAKLEKAWMEKDIAGTELERAGVPLERAWVGPERAEEELEMGGVELEQAG